MGFLIDLPNRTTLLRVEWFERIEMNPNVMGGSPVFRGTRVPVRLIENFLLAGNSPEDILREYEGRLPEDDVRRLADRVALHLATRSVVVTCLDTHPPQEFIKTVSTDDAFAP